MKSKLINKANKLDTKIITHIKRFMIFVKMSLSSILLESQSHLKN